MKHFWDGFEKRAWDSDFEDKHVYGISANRAISGSGYLHDALLKASKDPHLEVELHSPERTTSSKDRENFLDHMNEIRKDIGPRRKKLGLDRMDWHRDHGWSISGRKDNTIFKPKKGERDEYGDPMTVNGKILDYIRKNDI